jgi:undecaprenyl diphosphate synthase
MSTQPRHLAIIMDGNGRWAQLRGHSRFFGHVRGAKTARKIIEAAAARKIEFLTLYTFSIENWRRPEAEVNFLMKLLRRQLVRELKTLMENNIRFRVIGDINRLPREVQKVVNATIEETKTNTGMTLVFALSQLEAADVDENLVSACLESAFLPDPDLIVRTSGESRLSNFFLWQAAYSELLTLPTLWPDFTQEHLDLALQDYARRERRFGQVKEADAHLV